MDKQEDALRQFGKRLSQIRDARGIAVAELALRCGLDPEELSAIEAGKKDIHITEIFRLAAGLGIPPSQLMTSR